MNENKIEFTSTTTSNSQKQHHQTTQSASYFQEVDHSSNDDMQSPLISSMENDSTCSDEGDTNCIQRLTSNLRRRKNTSISLQPEISSNNNNNINHNTSNNLPLNGRILDRRGRFHQSLGKWNVKHSNHDLDGTWYRAKFYWQDWFHSLLYSPTHRVFICLFFFYTLTVLAFGLLYYLVSRVGKNWNFGGEGFCNMDISNVMEAIYFSLSTMTTIGYGVSDYYFGDCWAPFCLVLLQVFFAITFDAVAIGLIFQRLSRGRKRGRTIVFSDKAVVRRVGGELYFMFRMGELVKRHLVEAHVRVYCVRHIRERMGGCFPSATNMTSSASSSSSDSPVYTSLSSLAAQQAESPNSAGCGFEDDTVETTYFQAFNMRLKHPSDELGSRLLMTLPSVIVHRVDKLSPMMPRSTWYDATSRSHEWSGCGFSPKQDDKYADINATESSSSTSTTGLTSPLLSEEPNQQKSEPNMSLSDRRKLRHYQIEQLQIQSFLSDRDAEIVILVEGVDEATSNVIQAKHSYKWDDIVWNASFAPCVKRGAPGQPFSEYCIVDFDKFHDLVDAPLDCEGCSFITKDMIQ